MNFVTIILAAIALCALAVIIWLVAMHRRTGAIAREAERLVPATGKTLEIEGNRIHYVETGEGPPILLIHGLGGHHHHMRPLMAPLGDSFRVISLDRAGSGWSTRAAGMTGNLREQARLIARFIDEMGLERPVLVGHSLGGAIALATALDYPDKVSGLALISPLTHSFDEVPPEFRPLYIPNRFLRRLVAHTIAVPTSVRNAEKTLAFVFGPQQPPADYAIEGGGMLGLRPSHIFATSTDIVAVGNDLPALQDRYGELAMPVGVLFGTEDRVLDHIRHGLAMKEKVGGIELEIVEGVGHMPQYSQTRLVADFIRRISRKAFETGKADMQA
ncbi:MAG: alpha/beta fold hydrolase [Rhizobiaceae bacterium]|nr:alpha/beta fold hydrolase [Rhizobiaceae bacterium]MCV0406398.1 alpha/beta fold hydrolase [Rhizobiaceae bacterium]